MYKSIKHLTLIQVVSRKYGRDVAERVTVLGLCCGKKYPSAIIIITIISNRRTTTGHERPPPSLPPPTTHPPIIDRRYKLIVFG